MSWSVHWFLMSTPPFPGYPPRASAEILRGKPGFFKFGLQRGLGPVDVGLHGPQLHPEGLGDFIRLRTKLDGCMAGSMLARDAAAESLQKVMIPAALDYPQ